MARADGMKRKLCLLCCMTNKDSFYRSPQHIHLPLRANMKNTLNLFSFFSRFCLYPTHIRYRWIAMNSYY